VGVLHRGLAIFLHEKSISSYKAKKDEELLETQIFFHHAQKIK
jgi:hypothetical protein